MKFCQVMTFVPAAHVVELSRVAQDVGFDSVAFSDHIAYPVGFTTPYPYSADGMPTYTAETPWLDPLIAIAACASAADRLRFLTNVYVLGYRHPIAAAKLAASASFLTGGRLLLGVGAGWMREEFEALDEPFERRGARMVEAIDIVRGLWKGEPLEHHGEFYDFAPVQLSPAPPDSIPVLIGGHTELALRRAAALGDGWIGLDYDVDELRRLLGLLRSLRAEAGTSDKPFEVITGVRAKPEPELLAELTELGMTTLITSAFGFGRTDLNDLQASRQALVSYGRRFIEPLGEQP